MTPAEIERLIDQKLELIAFDLKLYMDAKLNDLEKRLRKATVSRDHRKERGSALMQINLPEPDTLD